MAASVALLLLLPMPARASLSRLTLSGPGTFTPGATIAGFSGRLVTDSTPSAGLPGQTVEILLDGAVVRTLRTGTDGSFAFSLSPLPAAPAVRTLTATAYRGTPLEVQSQPHVIRTVARLTITPPQVDLGSLVGGRDSVDLSFAITNDGGSVSGSLTQAVDGLDISITSSTCARAQLGPGETCSIAVRFTASLTGPRFDAVRVAAAPGGTQVAALRATVRGVSAPSAMVYGSLKLGQIVFRQLLVTNDSSVSLGPLSIALDSAGDFVIADDACRGVSLAPGQQCTMTVSFTPLERGPRTGSIRVSSVPGGTASTALTGSGAAPRFRLDPVDHDFGEVPQNTSRVHTFTVFNVGDDISGPIRTWTCCDNNFGVIPSTNMCEGAQIAPGESCTVDVYYHAHYDGGGQARFYVEADPGDRVSATIRGENAIL